ncbi:MAG: hypothetical protein BRC56_01380 [Cyanobacteria bacterium SW_9_47_5]|nr:MAG: hypothetical protein BRC56_01380 [Cyanobacteria bacterium SW_9_47_5]
MEAVDQRLGLSALSLNWQNYPCHAPRPQAIIGLPLSSVHQTALSGKQVFRTHRLAARTIS